MSDGFVHVVVGLVQKEKQVLIAKRLANKHQGGLWEFPGGKLESGESAFSALSRELEEEVGIDIHAAIPFLKIYHHYSDKAVFLDIYSITDFTGEAKGQEGQLVSWVERSDLLNYDFPAANQKIIKALFVPEQISITPENINRDFDFYQGVKHALALGCGAILLRAPKLNDTEYLDCTGAFANAIERMHASNDLKLLVNRESALQQGLAIDGLHLSSEKLLEVHRVGREKYIEKTLLLSASCHSSYELTKAQQLDCDFVFLSPVNQTSSHPQAKALGWQAVKGLIEATDLPVLLLGGLAPEDKQQSKECGAFGVAGISRFGLK